jgi:transposase
MARESSRAKTKAAAIADLMDGVQPAVVAARYGLNAATVRSWKARLDIPVATGVATGVATVIRQPAVEAQQLAIGDMIMENLRAKLIATQRIAEYATTQDWIDKQNAADMATLFTALDQSAVAILDRLAQRGHADERTADLDGPAPDATA